MWLFSESVENFSQTLTPKLSFLSLSQLATSALLVSSNFLKGKETAGSIACREGDVIGLKPLPPPEVTIV